ncbi:MAG: polyprenyl synthetase family protein [Rikenellaceae bacterium]|nr:polyprenyl synthetase family protein [Rikenellaceae bacterium]
MITLDEIRRPIEGLLEEFDRFIGEHFTADGELLSEMLHHALSARGKGVRPMLVFLSALLHAGEASRVGQRSHLAAMLVEMIHTASLIHDDVIDEADERRGRPSANALWQSRNAVILGDYILARNMSIGLESGQFDLVTHITRAMTTLCEGEVLQSENARRKIVSRERYLDVIRRKTASLLAVSASAGALSVGACSDKVERMHRIGEALGMAFQIQDDVLDYLREAETGKPKNNDLREGKITLPLLHVLEHASAERQAELLERLAACHSDNEAVEYLQAVVEGCGGLEEARRVMEEYITRAQELLREYDPSPAREGLEKLARFIGERLS